MHAHPYSAVLFRLSEEILPHLHGQRHQPVLLYGLFLTLDSGKALLDKGVENLSLVGTGAVVKLS